MVYQVNLGVTEPGNLEPAGDYTRRVTVLPIPDGVARRRWRRPALGQTHQGSGGGSVVSGGSVAVSSSIVTVNLRKFE